MFAYLVKKQRQENSLKLVNLVFDSRILKYEFIIQNFISLGNLLSHSTLPSHTQTVTVPYRILRMLYSPRVLHLLRILYFYVFTVRENK